jgi:hypothetical protein
MFESAFVPMLAFIFESLGALAIPHIAGAVWASARAINYTEGAATPVWLAFIWLMPCLGPVLALIAIRKAPILPPPEN